MIEREIYDFLVSWNAWVSSGAPNTEPFYRSYGLCGNGGNFGIRHTTSKFAEIFRAQGLDPFYPFDKDEAAYYRDVTARKMHLNPRRLRWVKMMIEQHAKEFAK